MPKVRILKAFAAYEGDSFPRVRQVFHAGDECDVSDEMLETMIEHGVVEMVLENKPEPVELETGKRRRRK
jgi:hypothetical protein